MNRKQSIRKNGCSMTAVIVIVAAAVVVRNIGACITKFIVMAKNAAVGILKFIVMAWNKAIWYLVNYVEAPFPNDREIKFNNQTR